MCGKLRNDIKMAISPPLLIITMVSILNSITDNTALHDGHLNDCCLDLEPTVPGHLSRIYPDLNGLSGTQASLPNWLQHLAGC